MTDAARHIELEELSAFADGDLDAAATARVAAHTEECVECRGDLDALRATISALAALPPISMPGDVAARLDAALARAATPVATSGTILPMRRRAPVWLAAAASVAVLAAGGAYFVTQQHPAKRGPAAEAAPSVAAAPLIVETDTNYTPTTLASDVTQLLSAPPPAKTELSTDSAAGSGPDGVAAPRTTQFGATKQADAYARLRDDGKLHACADALAAGSTAQLVAVDYARFKGQPAVIVVLTDTDRADKLDVFVVRASCVPGNEQLLYFGRIDRR